MSVRGRRWCFTVNNPTAVVRANLQLLECNYIVYGNEVAQTGTPHLQGFVIFANARRRDAIQTDIGGGVHLELTRGTSKQASDYCKKDGDFVERGVLPNAQGKRTDIDLILQWLDDFIADNGRAPSKREVALHQPKALLRYRNFLDLATLRAPPPVLRQGEPQPWQRVLSDELDVEADDRKVIFYVDPDGGKGKSWFQQWYYSKNPDYVQILGTGTFDNIAYSLDTTRFVFLINVARGGMEYLQYRLLEALKDRMVFSQKYESMMKTWSKNVHVVIFCNEQPDMAKMTEDRYDIRYNF